MREYVDWEQDGGRTKVRIHRRVLAGLERETGDFGGMLFGTASPGEVAVEDFAIGAPDKHSLEPVGYFHVASEESELGDADWDAGLLHLVLLFRRGAEGIRLAKVVVKPRERTAAVSAQGAAPAHRVLFRAGEPARGPSEPEPETRSWRRFLLPAAAIAAGLAIGAAAYLSMSGDARGGGGHREVARTRPADPMPVPPAAAPKTPAQFDADRSAESKPADRAQVQKEIRETLTLWTGSLLAGDPDAHARLYAESVSPYFTKTRVSRAQVADEVRQMLKRYGPMRAHRLSDVTIAAVDADHAIANFRKYWATEGRKFAGEEREQLKFTREGSEWRITAEQELKVYWVRRKDTPARQK